MKVLTFDIEDWYNCDFIDKDLSWERHEVRIYSNVDRILEVLEKTNTKGTFFCLGWLAENHPQIIKKIADHHHHIGCHSYQHQLSSKLTDEEFRCDTERAKKLLEDTTGKEVNAFRAPGFSITKNNIQHLEILVELGFIYDASIFPANHDYGGLPEFGKATPSIIETKSGNLKEFPLNIQKVFGRNLVFSGGGFFRILPYPLIKKLSSRSDYLMTYFHPRDFDIDQPVVKSLPILRRFKSYVGLRNAFNKFQHYINDFDFLSIEQLDKNIDWAAAERRNIFGNLI